MINWEKFDLDLKNSKYKYLVIFKFFNLLDYLDDTNASIIIRLIIKNYIDIFVEHPFILLCKYIPSRRYHETINVIITFYELIKEKNECILLLYQWYKAFKKKYFWNKNINQQIEFLNILNEKISALFDNSKGGVPFGNKMLAILKTNINNAREEIINIAMGRLLKTYSLMGYNFFKENDIPVLYEDEFEDLPDEKKGNYVNLIHFKTTNIISQTIELFEKLNMINLKIDNLLDPCYVQIEEDTYLDYDVEDIKIFFS